MRSNIFCFLSMLLLPYLSVAQVSALPGVEGYTIVASGLNGGPTTAAGDRFGIACDNIGDLDNDGIEDIVVGSYFDDNGGSNTDAGAVFVCFMNSDKTVKSSVKIGKATSALSSDIGNGDLFGCSVAGIGDLNGDGHEDIAVGAYASDAGLTNSGAVYIFFLDSTASVLSYKKLRYGANGVSTTIQANSWLGHGVASIGDIDGDGVNDIAVGEPRYSVTTSAEEGAVWIFFMNTDGTVKSSQMIAKSTGGFGTLTASDNFGINVTGAGDMNNDGINDILVGAYQDDTYSTNSGCFYLLCLNSSGTVVSYKKYNQPFVNNVNYSRSTQSIGRALSCKDLNDDGRPEYIVGLPGDVALLIVSTNADGDIISTRKISTNKSWNYGIPNGAGNFGMSVASLNDIDGDGKIEYVVGVSDYDAASLTNNGGIYILDLENASQQPVIGAIADYDAYGELSNTIVNLDADDRFGVSVCDIGDLDADGYRDIAIGSRLDDDGGSDRGSVYIVFLDANQNKKSVQKISSTAGGFGSGLDNGDNFGVSLASPGDLDADGVPDLFVGAYNDDDGGSNRGAVWVLYLNSNGTVKGKHKISTGHGGFTGTLSNGCLFGASLAAIGDVDHDGINDLAVGEYLDDDGGTDRGAAWIIFMNAADSVKGNQKISDTQGNFLETFSGNSVDFGISMSRAGDLNGDGKEDLIVGSDAMNGTGAVYILYLDTLGKVDSFVKINNEAANFTATLQSGKLFGRSVAMINDLNADGYDEIAIGQVNYTSYGTDKGAVWIAFPDSAGNVKDVRLLAEGEGMMYAPVSTGDFFGNSLSDYIDWSGTHHLFAGMPVHNENGAAEGGLLKWTLLTAGSVFHAALTTPSNEKYYVSTRKEIDGGYYLTNNGKLRVRYVGEYDSSYPLKFNVYNTNYDVVATESLTAILGSSSTQSFGENFFTFDFSMIPLTMNQHYILEIINQKEEKEYLRFKYTPFAIPGSPK